MSDEKELSAIRMGKLLARKLSHGLTEQEETELEQWRNQSKENQLIYDDFLNGKDLKRYANLSKRPGDITVYRRIRRRYYHSQSGTKVRKLPVKWIAIAAMLMAACMIGYYLWQSRMVNDSLLITDIDPGTNKATLVLADGSKVELSSLQEGIIISEGNIKYHDGSYVNPDSQISEPPTSDLGKLTLTVPKGGQYQVTLPDGTKVWLNAASELKYPVRFSGNIREVEVNGEAFFEVAENKAKPFRVLTRNQVVDVLGTSFNINSYPEETAVKTTLITGAAQVSVAHTGMLGKNKNSTALKLVPGEETILSETGMIKKQQADIESAVSWKEGLIVFSGVPFDVIMRQIGRWYNVDIIYATGIPNVSFRGEMRRGVKLSVLLEFLRDSGIHFRMEEGRKLIITNAG